MYGRGSFFLICSWLVMLWEVTDCRRADPVRHYEAVDVSLFMACLAELILLFLSFDFWSLFIASICSIDEAYKPSNVLPFSKSKW